MAHSKKPGSGNKRRLYYFIPLLGLLLVVAAYALSVYPYPRQVAAVDFSSKLIIEVHDPSNETLIRCVYPRSDVGVLGGFWLTHVYDKYGLDSNYPVYATIPTTISCPTALAVHVRSSAARNYTLGDFFNVWGQPLGPDNTIGQPPNAGMQWVMCVGTSVRTLRPGNWGQEVLANNVTMIVTYTRVAGCS